MLAALLATALLAASPVSGSRLMLKPVPTPRIGVLLFHQVTKTPIESAHGADLVQRPWATPAEFDRVLTELQKRGFTVIPVTEAVRYLSGKLPATALPRFPVVLTFDDGFRTAWTEATPILRAHHDTATMFFEGHATDNPQIPGRLSTGDLRAMAASGIWTLESHGYAGHSNIQIDRAGTLSPYWYANLAWLAQQHRLETPQEFEQRVERDLARMRSQYEPVIGKKITLFAYPSGEYGQNPSLEPGEDPSTSIEAGHSNARGLTPYLIEALRNAGYDAAFAVSLPLEAHLAQQSDSLWKIPRLGVGADFKFSFFEALAAQHGAEYPEVADGHIADVGPICADSKTTYVASTNRPVIFALDRYGRKTGEATFAPLVDGRPSGNAGISGLACTPTGLLAVQQAGFDPNPTPYLDRFQTGAQGPQLVSRTALPPAMNWLVGIASDGATLYGIDDRGSIFDVTAGRSIGMLDSSLRDDQRHDRFSGLAFHGGLLFSIDRAESQIVTFTPQGHVVGRTPIDAGSRDLAFDGTKLLVSFWTTNFRSMRTYDIVETPRQ